METASLSNFRNNPKAGPVRSVLRFRSALGVNFSKEKKTKPAVSLYSNKPCWGLVNASFDYHASIIAGDTVESALCYLETWTRGNSMIRHDDNSKDRNRSLVEVITFVAEARTQ